MKKDSGHESDLDFLSEDLPKDKVTREVALDDLKRFLTDRKLLTKTVKRAERSDEDRENFESAKEIFIVCVMDGTFVITDDSPCNVIHTLTEPPRDLSGNTLFETLEYKFVPDLASLKRLDRFGDDETNAKMQSLLSTLTKKNPQELGKISTRDNDAIAAISFFFV